MSNLQFQSESNTSSAQRVGNTHKLGRRKNSTLHQPLREAAICLGRLHDSLERSPIASNIVAGIVAGIVLLVITAVVAFAVGKFRPEAPLARGAELAEVRIVDSTTTLRQFLVDYYDLPASKITTDQDFRRLLSEKELPTEISNDDLATLGFSVAFDIELTGLVNQPCSLTWTLYDASSGERVPDTYLQEQPAFPHHRIMATANSDRSSEQIWIPRPPRAGRFFVRLELQEDGVPSTRLPLERIDSPPIS